MTRTAGPMRTRLAMVSGLAVLATTLSLAPAGASPGAHRRAGRVPALE